MSTPQKTKDSKKTDDASQTSRSYAKPAPAFSVVSPLSVIQRAQVAPDLLTPADVMMLQRQIGNRAVTRLLGGHSSSPPVVQAKLTVNARGDEYEEEADEVAETVMASAGHELRGTSNSEHSESESDLVRTSSSLQRHHDEEEAIQTKSLNTAQTKITVGAPSNLIQRHSSFEHRLFGDTPTEQLTAMAGQIDPANRQHVLEEERQRLQIWEEDPEAVTEEEVNTQWPEIRTVRLKGSGLLATYGELNALPDYTTSPEAIDSAGKEIILPLLQKIRQQNFNRITDMVGATRTIETPEGPVTVPDHRKFEGSLDAQAPGAKGRIANIQEVRALDELTEDQGGGVDQYSALLARNACHFAPFSWDRWEEFHNQARTLAEQGHAENDTEKIRQAWLNNGYADHFLQDSFAAGHLINKTLIMQWYVAWLESENRELENWWRIRTMTVEQQPEIAGTALYDRKPEEAKQSTDPQSAEEQPTRQERMAASGVQASKGFTQEEAYQNYLAFLNSSAVQLASGAVHDHFNERSLWVSSPAIPNAYQIWGDETMLNGGEGVQIASETAQLSQQAIAELAQQGTSAITSSQIRDRFPNQVRDETSGTMLSLEEWHEQLHQFCIDEIFPKVWGRSVDFFSPTLGKVSQDQEANLDLSDKKVRDDVSRLGDAGVAQLPLSQRIQMVLRLTEGATFDADEITIISILRASNNAGDLVTLVDVAGAWKLSYVTDGEEYDLLREFLNSHYYAQTSQDTALRLIRRCMDGETAEWEEEMIADILVARSDGRDIITRIGQIYDKGGFNEGLNKLESQLDGEDQDRVAEIYGESE